MQKDMRKMLSIFQIIDILVSALLPLLDGMFVWITYNDYQNLSEKYMSLSNLMTVQQIGAGPILYPIFYITLLAMVVYCVLELFYEDKFKKKAIIIVPVLSFLLGVLMIMTADHHTDSFLWNGNLRYVAVTLGILAYVELTLLIINPIIECYKQFKCDA